MLGLRFLVLGAQAEFGDDAIVCSINEGRVSEVIAEEAFYSPSPQIVETSAALEGQGNREGRTEVEGIGLVLHGGFFPFDMMKKSFVFLHVLAVCAFIAKRFAEVPLEGVLFDFEGFQSRAKGVGGGFPDGFDFAFQFGTFIIGVGDMFLGRECAHVPRNESMR
jgi:hypothetical protein